MTLRGVTVWLVAGDAVLAAGLAGALAVIGWSAVRTVDEVALLPAVRGAGPPACLVLVAEPAGHVPDPRPAFGGRVLPRAVAVGGRAALAGMAESVERRVARDAIDAELPLTDLAGRLDRAVRGPSPRPPGELAARLRARADEARRCSTLTPREREMLGSLVVGCSAADIAAREHVSLATVRSHIRAVLVKLGVSSQLAAVAVALRSAGEPELVERLRQVHQF